MHSRTRRPSPALIIAIIALVASLSGTAFAALGKNTVGSKQLKSKSVKTGKIAPNAVNSTKVANESLTSEDIRLSTLTNVPSALEATHANNADTVGAERHVAFCPEGTVLIRGLCYDVTLQGPVAGVGKAASACAAKGGFLPSVMQLYTARNLIFLGDGKQPEHAVADMYYYDNFDPLTVTVDGAGTIKQLDAEGVGSSTKYICAYELVR
jgi:hypothetical protein